VVQLHIPNIWKNKKCSKPPIRLSLMGIRVGALWKINDLKPLIHQSLCHGKSLSIFSGNTWKIDVKSWLKGFF
jgi:hypothetical protein